MQSLEEGGDACLALGSGDQALPMIGIDLRGLRRGASTAAATGGHGVKRVPSKNLLLLRPGSPALPEEVAAAPSAAAYQSMAEIYLLSYQHDATGWGEYSIYYFHGLYNFFVALLSLYLPFLQRQNGLSDDSIGFMLSMQMVALLLFVFPSNFLIKKYGSAVVLQASSLLTCLAFPFVLVPGGAHMMWPVLLIGCCYAATETAVTVQASLYESGSGESIMGKFFASYGLGGIVAMISTGKLLEMQLDASKIAVGLCSCSALLCAVAYRGLVPADIESKVAAASAEVDFTDGERSNRESGASVTLLLVMLSVTCIVVLMDVAVVDWAVLFMQDTMHASELTSTFSFIVYYLTASFAGVVVDYVSLHHLISRRALLLVLGFLGLVGYLIIGLVGLSEQKSVPLAILGFSVGGTGAPAVTAVCYQAVLTLNVFNSVNTLSFLTLAANFGAALSGAVIGHIGAMSHGDLSNAWFFLAACMVACMLMGELWVPLGGDNTLGKVGAGERKALLGQEKPEKQRAEARATPREGLDGASHDGDDEGLRL